MQVLRALVLLGACTACLCTTKTWLPLLDVVKCGDEARCVPREVIVSFKPTLEWLDMLEKELPQQLQGPLEFPMQFPGLELLRPIASFVYLYRITSLFEGPMRVVERLANYTGVAFVEPNFVVTTQVEERVAATMIEPNDDKFPLQYALQRISAPRAWSAYQDDVDANVDLTPVSVGVTDSGVDPDHPDLVDQLDPNLQTGYCLGCFGTVKDRNGHGTHVAGTIAATPFNGQGIAGTAGKGVKLAVCRFLDNRGGGTVADALSCLSNMRKRGVRIIQSSWGCTACHSRALYNEIQILCNEGGLFVSAAGNGNGRNNDLIPFIPSSYRLDCVIAVASTDREDKLSPFSNVGRNSVDLAAPGSDILSTWPTYLSSSSSEGPYQYLSGTSMAAPHVAGAAALLMGRSRGTLSGAQIKQALMANVDRLEDLEGKMVSGGRLNMFKALMAIEPARPVVEAAALLPKLNLEEADSTAAAPAAALGAATAPAVALDADAAPAAALGVAAAPAAALSAAAAPAATLGAAGRGSLECTLRLYGSTNFTGGVSPSLALTIEEAAQCAPFVPTELMGGARSARLNCNCVGPCPTTGPVTYLYNAQRKLVARFGSNCRGGSCRRAIADIDGGSTISQSRVCRRNIA